MTPRPNRRPYDAITGSLEALLASLDSGLSQVERESQLQAMAQSLRSQPTPQGPNLLVPVLLLIQSLQKQTMWAKGEQGEPGYTPVKGIDYVDGKDGRDGKDGKDGSQGPKGEKGDPGEPGEDGENAIANMEEVKALCEAMVKEHEESMKHHMEDMRKSLSRTRSGGVLRGGGKSKLQIRTITEDYTLVGTDDAILADASSAALTVTLPPASVSKGREIKFKKIDSSDNGIVLTPQSGDLIDGETTRTLIVQYQPYFLTSDGTHWYLF